ncbi:hypothetical protein SPF06_05395 [Sinomonas sp. JGH33]|uniref:Uncharacterized protein n=1 Tax=Sinomonas terricola TaxID=3110330 RepID=A0ABU5T399_9MICC|nr:hypothetical protein [Sinomonas sp. JGH33]MEA5454155.1 hypothetical protein [Sinomonas sp. JGH33]
MSKTPAQRARKHGERAAVAPSGRTSLPEPSKRKAQPGEGNPKLIVIAALGATVFMFWYFHLLTLAQMTQLSNGLAMPDSMLAGFPPAYIEQLRAAMNGDALGQLSYVHKTAGTIFALAFGLTFALVAGMLLRRRAARWAGFALVAAFVVVRVGSYVAIDGALGSQPLSAGQAVLASVLVVVGWVLFAVVLLGAAALGVLTWRARQRPPARA